MDYQEKLRLAKEALNSNSYDKRTIEYIFPELKESEDERIRKTIVNHLSELSKSRVNLMTKATYENWIAWLEKQGEQKPTDKVESKFKVGDWINKDGAIWRIEGISGKEYSLGGRPDVIIQEPIHIIDSEFQLWTIQDAKDGDVLVIESGRRTLECLFIFKDIANREVLERCYYRISDKTFSPTGSYIGYLDNNYHPATKEQRDLFFQKMKEAGYEWDAEKKELKKIEEKFIDKNVDCEKPLLEKFKQAVYDCAWGKVTCKAKGETKLLDGLNIY